MTTYIALYLAIGFFIGVGIGVYATIINHNMDIVAVSVMSIPLWPLIVIVAIQVFFIDVISKKIMMDEKQPLSEYNCK